MTMVLLILSLTMSIISGLYRFYNMAEMKEEYGKTLYLFDDIAHFDTQYIHEINISLNTPCSTVDFKQPIAINTGKHLDGGQGVLLRAGGVAECDSHPDTPVGMGVKNR